MKNMIKTVGLFIGAVIEDYAGILRKRTNIKDDKSTHADNYYYIPIECYCDKTFDSSGHTYSDEYGPCDYCKSMARQVNGNNTAITVDFNDQSLNKGKNTKKRVFGNSLIGAWYCPKCSYQIFPNKLKELEDSFIWSNGSKSVSEAFVGPHCKKCNIPMEYDEFE